MAGFALNSVVNPAWFIQLSAQIPVLSTVVGMVANLPFGVGVAVLAGIAGITLVVGAGLLLNEKVPVIGK